MKLPICINSLIVFIFVILLTNIIYNTESYRGAYKTGWLKRQRNRATAKARSVSTGQVNQRTLMKSYCNKKIANCNKKIVNLKTQHKYNKDQMEQNYEDKIEELDKDITQCESNLLDRNIEIQRLGEEIVDKQNSIDDITSQYAYLESDIKAKRTQSFSRQQL